MLDHEYALLKERLWEVRGERTTFFAFADTVAAKSFKGNNEAHGWMGVRFQSSPKSEPSDIVIHVRMWDKENVLQQQALGIIGVNLIYGAFYYKDDPGRFIESLLDNLNADRIEVDMIQFSGPDFQGVDNRLMSLLLVQKGLTNAVMFGPERRACSSPPRSSTKRPSSSSAAASGPSRTSTSTCSTAPPPSSSRSRRSRARTSSCSWKSR